MADLASPVATGTRSRTASGSGIYPTCVPDSSGSLTVSYTLPSHSRGMGIQAATAYTDEQEAPQKLLIFHGIILRSQLVMLLKNRVYFHEDQGVCGG